MQHFTSADWPIPLPSQTLKGRLVQLETLTEAHADALALAGSDSSVWRYTSSRGDSLDSMRAYVLKQRMEWERGTATPFAVRKLASGQIVGCTRLKDLDRSHRKAVVGSWYAPEAWRTGVNLEAKLLLLDYAFLTLGCVRIEFHADTRNERSRRSLEKLGAKFEGVLRAHQITRDGTLRDSAIYSIVAGEWPAVRSGLQQRIKH